MGRHVGDTISVHNGLVSLLEYDEVVEVGPVGTPIFGTFGGETGVVAGRGARAQRRKRVASMKD